MLIKSLLIFHAISVSLCNDIQLEDVLKVSKELLKVLNRNQNIANKLSLPGDFASRGKLSSFSRAKSAPQKTNVNHLSEKYYSPDLEDFTFQLKQTGMKTFEKIGKQILYELNLSDKNITDLVRAVNDDYMTRLNNYYNFVTEHNTLVLIEKDYLYLDMVDTYCRLLQNGEEKLLNDIIMRYQTEPQNTTTQAINDKMKKNMIIEKKRKLNDLCDKYQVCKEYSTFINRLGDVINQILELPNDKFNIFIKILSNIIKNHTDVLEIAMEKEERNIMLSKLYDISRDVNSVKEFLAVLKSVISQRNKIISKTDTNQKLRTLATRILFDIIDKALDSDDDNILDIDFNIIISAIDRWANDDDDDDDSIRALSEFVDNTIRRLKYKMTRIARKEINILITTILGRTTRNDPTFDYLFTYGSKYVKGNDFFFDVDDMLL
ncbi:hypothetical protein HF086_006026 [Spodoptera exigua]|uniref:Uncharacterized protein n=1 Tax=Spodoptera exigua TaxID=7107 RepID=A0A922SPD5_SPOEX|nr:hypothetical protein HF086_006026 [Spodoptera exigua]